MQITGLTIALLGGLTIDLDGKPVSGFASRKVEALLVYLVCRGRPVARDELARLLWPRNELPRGRANLSVALNSLRKALSAYIRADRDAIAFDTRAPHRVDLHGFEQALAQAYSRYDAQDRLTRSGALYFRRALTLYRGPFLAGFHVRGAPAFDDWLAGQQRHFDQERLDALRNLVDYERGRNRPGHALVHAQALLAADPLDEETHRLLMALYAANDQRAAALAQYQQCCEMLATEFGSPAEPATQELYLRIQKNEPSESAEPPGTPDLVLPAATVGHPVALMGRAAELAEIDRWFDEPDSPLLTLTGPGGIGKTRLVQEVVTRHQWAFRDGLAYVPLESVTDLTGLTVALADALNLPPASLAEPHQALVQHLRDRELLLVLDNLEHLLTDACRAFLCDLLDAGPDLRLLATSRRRLELPGERLLTLGGLAYHVSGDDPTGITETPAGRLFLSRARPLLGDAELTGQEVHLAELCRLVDGLPLALELAATWVRALSLAEIVAEVRRNSRALATGSRDLPARHQSLQAVVDSSWTLLDVPEQDAFARLAVFRGGFTAAAAAAVAHAHAAILTRLVDSSLLRLEDGHGPARYRRHPLLYQYAEEKLQARADADDVRAAHARFYGRLLQEQEGFLLGRSPETGLMRLRREVENIKPAWVWAADHRESAVINQMSDSIMQAFDLFGLYQDVVAMAKRALAAYDQAPLETDEDVVAYGRVLGLAGAFAFRMGEYETAAARCRESLAVLDPQRPHIAYAHSQIYAGAAAFGLGEFDLVRDHWLGADQEYDAVGSIWGRTTATINLSEVELLLGNTAEAQCFAEQGYALADGLGNDELKGAPLQVMASIALAAGDLDAAQRYAEEAVDCHRRTRHDAHLGNALARLGSVRAAQGALDAAHDHLAESVQILRESGNHLYHVTHLVELGRIRQEVGDLAGAEDAYREAARTALQTQTVEVVLRALAHQAHICARTGRTSDACRLARFVSQHDGAVADVKTLADDVCGQVGAAEATEMDSPDEGGGTSDEALADLSDAVALALGRANRRFPLPALDDLLVR